MPSPENRQSDRMPQAPSSRIVLGQDLPVLVGELLVDGVDDVSDAVTVQPEVDGVLRRDDEAERTQAGGLVAVARAWRASTRRADVLAVRRRDDAAAGRGRARFTRT